MIWIAILIGAVILFSSFKSTAAVIETPVSKNLVPPELYQTAEQVAATAGITAPASVSANCPPSYGINFATKQYVWIGAGVPPNGLWYINF
jgi:hypothetical protein